MLTFADGYDQQDAGGEAEAVAAPDEVVEYVREQLPQVNPSTVYRTLDLLVAEGLLLRADLGADRVYYARGFVDEVVVAFPVVKFADGTRTPGRRGARRHRPGPLRVRRRRSQSCTG